MKIMLKVFLWIILTFSAHQTVFALSMEQIGVVSKAVIELCRGGTLEGEATTYRIEGSGETKVVILKKLAELGISGDVVFSKDEWKGIKATIPEKWNQDSHNQCVNPNLKLFTDRLEVSKNNTTLRSEGSCSPNLSNVTAKTSISITCNDEK